MPGYITESEAKFYKDKKEMSSKFKEVFDFYHETVPAETEQQKTVPEPAKDDGDAGIQQTLDAEPKTEEPQS